MRRNRPSRLEWSGWAIVLGTWLAWCPAVFADTAVLSAGRDNTLIENPNGSLSNGAGPAIFAGRIGSASNSIRRAVIAFDVASAVPAGAIVTRAALGLEMSRTSAGPKTLRLHRLLADWGEGASSSTGGGGAPSATGDATWIHRSFDTLFWMSPGGDFLPGASAAQVVDQAGTYVWESAAITADVQGWADDAAGNFGWIVIGDESTPQTVKLFESRESADETVRPYLEIEYLPPCALNGSRDAGRFRRCLEVIE